jgi:hypothetical protein
MIVPQGKAGASIANALDGTVEGMDGTVGIGVERELVPRMLALFANWFFPFKTGRMKNRLTL